MDSSVFKECFTCHYQISADRCPDMDVDGIFRLPPKFLYGQVLLNPFEEGLYLPFVAVEFGDFESGHFHVVGQEKEIDIAFLVMVFHEPKGSGVELFRPMPIKSHGSICSQS